MATDAQQALLRLMSCRSSLFPGQHAHSARLAGMHVCMKLDMHSGHVMQQLVSRLRQYNDQECKLLSPATPMRKLWFLPLVERHPALLLDWPSKSSLIRPARRPLVSCVLICSDFISCDACLSAIITQRASRMAHARRARCSGRLELALYSLAAQQRKVRCLEAPKAGAATCTQIFTRRTKSKPS